MTKKILTSGRNESKDNFPEKSQKVHNVVTTGWHFLFSLAFFAFLAFFTFIVITFKKNVNNNDKESIGKALRREEEEKSRVLEESRHLPAWTVKASMNWSFQELAPTIREAFPRCIILSTELCKKRRKKVLVMMRCNCITSRISSSSARARCG